MVDAVAAERENDESCLLRGARRLSLLRILTAISGAVLIVAWGCTPRSAGPTPLAPVQSKFLRGGESYTASIVCRPGDNVLARVTQDNVDVTLELVDGPGPDKTKVDFPSGRFGDEFLEFRCEPSGRHHIVVASAAGSTPGGTIRLGFYSLAAAPASMLEGFRHMSNAARRNVVRGDHTWDDVLRELRSAGEIWKTGGMQRELALTEFALGYVYYMDLTEWPAAAEHARMAAELFAGMGDQVGQASSRQLQGAALEEAAAAHTGPMDDPERRRMFASSESLLRDAEAEQRRLGRAFDAAMSHDYMALNYYYQGREDAAASTLSQAQDEFAALEERSSQSMVLQNIATIYYENGGYAKAKEAFETLLPLMKAEDDPYLYATVLHNSALVLSVTGDVERALERELAALEIQRKRESKSGEARSLYAIGIAYQRLGQYDRAREFLENSLALDKQGLAATPVEQGRVASQRMQLLSTLLGMGNVERAQGNFTRAAVDHAEARQYASSEKNQSRVELALGLDYAAMGKPQSALANLDLALSRGTADSNPYFVEIAVARSGALRQTGAAARGLRTLRQASQVALANGNLREQAMVSTELAASEAASGDRRAALEEVKRAVLLSERLRMNASNPELRAEIAATRRDAYRLWVKLLLSNESLPAGRGFSQPAAVQSLIVADQSHGRALIELLHRPQSPDTSADRAEDTEQIYDELAGKQATLDSLLERDRVDAQRVGQLREEIAVLQAKADLANRAPGSAAFNDNTQFTVASLDELRRRMSKECAVIEYLLSSEASWAWVVQHNQVALYRLPGEAPIKALAGNVRRALQAPLAGNHWSDSARALADVILRPALSGLSGECLVIVPDGDLHYVPFAVLRSALGVRADLPAAVSVAPSLAVLAHGEPRGGVQRPRSRVAVFAPYAVTEGSPAQPSLPALNSEVSAIKAAFGTDNTYVANSNETTRSGFARFGFNGFGIVHIATHGSADISNGGMSRLIFGSGLADDLRAYDISKMRFDSPLIVLSACDSGLGKPVDGEGLLGLVHAFIGAGAESVVMSLWKVPDDATARLMGAFYRALHGGSVTPERALAEAQLETKSLARWDHPYYWSGFEVFSTRLPFLAPHHEEMHGE